jgi:hypothetical protein
LDHVDAVAPSATHALAIDRKRRTGDRERSAAPDRNCGNAVVDATIAAPLALDVITLLDCSSLSIRNPLPMIR